jgi:mono/diheme cytochrome c family protein
MNSKLVLNLLFIPGALLILAACQGAPSEKPPIHINPSMDLQPKYKAQSESRFFTDRSTMRPPVSGTVARGQLYDDTRYYYGKDENGRFVQLSPVAISPQLLERGRERYDIYCAPCHSKVGDGTGIIAQKGFMPPPNLHQDLYRNYPDGQIYNVISNGIRNMPSYKHMIPHQDRWAIVSYVRALQRSQNAALQDIPADKRSELK